LFILEEIELFLEILMRIEVPGCPPFRTHLDPERCDFSSFLRIVGENVNPIPQSYRSMAEHLGFSYDELIRSMPSGYLANASSSVESALTCATSDPASARYLEPFLKMRSFQRSIRPPAVDGRALATAIDSMEHAGVREKSAAFSPCSDGLAPSTVYSNVGTATGRLTVIEGPNPLVMPPSVKSAFRSRRNGGCILQLDLSAAEPRTALNLIGKRLDDDLYESLALSIIGPGTERSVSKQAVICALYGQSPANLGKLLPAGTDPRRVISSVRDYFEYSRLLHTIRADNSGGRIRNALGRPLNPPAESDAIVLSHYLQSSASEIAILLFDSFCSRFEGHLHPVYIIHDALLIDCEAEAASRLLGMKQLVLRHGDWPYPVKVTTI